MTSLVISDHVLLRRNHRHRIDKYLDTLLANQPISDGEATDHCQKRAPQDGGLHELIVARSCLTNHSEAASLWLVTPTGAVPAMKSEATAIFAPQDGRWKVTVSFDGRRFCVPKFWHYAVYWILAASKGWLNKQGNHAYTKSLQIISPNRIKDFL